MPLHKTRNDLPESVRKGVIAVFGSRLADAIDLQTHAKQAHWNVKGANFIALHELFDKVAEAVEGFADELAERVVQLGGTARGTARVVASTSSLKEYPLDIVRGADHVRALTASLAAFAAQMRAAIDACDKLGDKNAADIATEISREADKLLWFVESHAVA
jgi:starvation-inducible DNA-binding protein